jgi:hypothetical protein
MAYIGRELVAHERLLLAFEAWRLNSHSTSGTTRGATAAKTSRARTKASTVTTRHLQ